MSDLNRKTYEFDITYFKKYDINFCESVFVNSETPLNPLFFIDNYLSDYVYQRDIRCILRMHQYGYRDLYPYDRFEQTYESAEILLRKEFKSGLGEETYAVIMQEDNPFINKLAFINDIKGRI